MINKNFISNIMLCVASCNLYAASNVPIQRIDVIDLLGTGGAVTAVTVAFNNGGASPCFTANLPFQGAVSVLSGIGQSCVAPVNSIVVTTVGDVYDNTPMYYSIDTSFYLAQMTITELTAPVFNGSSGAVITPGVAQAIVTNRLKG